MIPHYQSVLRSAVNLTYEQDQLADQTESVKMSAKTEYDIPKEMKAIRYNKVKDYSLVTMPVPEPKPHEILVKGRYATIVFWSQNRS